MLGKTKDEIRKIYFKKKIPQFLTDASAEGELKEDELMELTGFLEELREEEKKTIKQFSGLGIFPETEELPSFENRSEQEEIEFQILMKNAENAVKIARSLMYQVYESIRNGTPVKQDDWVDYGLQIAGILHLIDADRVYKDQAYRRKLTDIIRKNGSSRKEAEEWAKVTDEYAKYKRAVLFKAQIEEFIMLAKKKAGMQM